MKPSRRWIAAALSACLLLGTLPAQGAWTNEERRQDLDFLVETLETKHPDPFANVTKQAFEAKRAEIAENMDKWSDLEFAIELQTLTAMLGDSHTQVSVGRAGAVRMLPLGVEWMENKWVLLGGPAGSEAALGGEIVTFAGRPMDEVCAALRPFVSADNEVKLRRQLSGALYVWEVLAHFGVVRGDEESIELTVRTADGKLHTVAMKPLTQTQLAQVETVDLRELAPAAVTAYDRAETYKLLELGGNTLYIQYNACREDPDKPMAAFAAEVAARLDTGRFGRVVIDLRYNGGGSDGVIWDMLTEVVNAMQRGVQLDVLIGEATFSSAIINAVQMKQLGARLVGEETSGSVDHFGSVQALQLPNSKLRLGVSSKMIDMGAFYQAAAPYGIEPLKPDLAAVQTVADLAAGVDTAVAALLTVPASLPPAEAEAAPQSARMVVDGKETPLAGVEIGGEHYVKLRDLAAALSGTAKRFDVAWSDSEEAVALTGGKVYTPVGGELQAAPEARTAHASGVTLALDGMPFGLAGAPGAVRVYEIGDNNYLRLRDLAAKLGFTVRWDEAGNAVQIETE